MVVASSTLLSVVTSLLSVDTSSVEDGTVIEITVVGIFSSSKPTNLLFGRFVAIVVVAGSTFSILAFSELRIDSTAELLMESSTLMTTSMGEFVVAFSVGIGSSEEERSALSVVEVRVSVSTLLAVDDSALVRSSSESKYSSDEPRSASEFDTSVKFSFSRESDSRSWNSGSALVSSIAIGIVWFSFGGFAAVVGSVDATVVVGGLVVVVGDDVVAEVVVVAAVVVLAGVVIVVVAGVVVLARVVVEIGVVVLARTVVVAEVVVRARAVVVAGVVVLARVVVVTGVVVVVVVGAAVVVVVVVEGGAFVVVVVVVGLDVVVVTVVLAIGLRVVLTLLAEDRVVLTGKLKSGFSM